MHTDAVAHHEVRCSSAARPLAAGCKPCESCQCTHNLPCCRYPYLLVDEYQDCNQLQIDIVNALQQGRNGTGSVTVVGDDRQAIYGFRGSMPGVFPLFVVGDAKLC